MPLMTFNPVPGPSPGTSHKPQLRILEAEFGDGYTQPTPDGLNHLRRTVLLKWDALTDDQAEAIHGFFLRHEGTKPFYYLPFGESTVRKWTCKEFDLSTEGGVWSYRANLIESFTNAR